MKTKRPKAVLLSTLIITSLVVPAVAVTLTLSASSVSASPDSYENIIRGKGTAKNVDQEGEAPWHEYESQPLIMTAKRVGSGGVAAAGIIPTCRTSPTPGWKNPANPFPHLDILFDNLFQWMVPGATNVIWYEGYNVYNTLGQCSDLSTALQDLGYDIAPDSTMPIANINLSAFHILVIPQFQLGTAGTGGDPSLFPDDEVQVIKDFVEGGGGLLIMDGSDFGGYNFYKVHNKILKGLGFEYYFQDDQVSDETNNWADSDYRPIADVDPATDIGSAYQAATGTTEIGLYSIGSLAKAGPGFSLYVLPRYQVGMPGATLEYTVNVSVPRNPLAVDLTVDLTVEGDWASPLEDTSLFVPVGENRETTFSVTIPTDALGTEDEIVVTGEARGQPGVRRDFTCKAYAAMRIEPTDDAYVSEDTSDLNYGSDYSLRIGRYYEYWQWDYLQFDLSAIPSGQPITDARLCLYCYYKYASGFDVACYEADDLWTEGTITWDDKPTPGDTTDTQFVSATNYYSPEPYFWNVTSFVQQEFEGDQRASFCLRPPEDLPESTSRAFWAKEGYENRTHPFLMVTTGIPSGVEVSISPSSQADLPGEDVTFTVTVNNNENTEDTFDLTAEPENADWITNISPGSLTLVGGTSGTATLTVTIPPTAKVGDSTTITVTTSDGDTDSDTCTATATTELPPDVSVSISPIEKSGKAGATLEYTVTVTNTGGAEDTFSLSVNDTAGWFPDISPSSLTISAGDSETATLSVTIPGTAEEDDSTTVTVTASDGATDSKTCTATAKAEEGGIPIVIPVAAVVVIVVIIGVALAIKH